ncbi:hypothetical protein BLA29_003246 [Euroglyphus maynei]|uniref:Uncharacterized protein n=1 Tax=Euroglyphus maynei TaxID=6958 RepID=A0A1Y3B8P9_EURMA|nr:hypothetical protein BLA29_003246 [Euroglyphus maynei]
MKPKERFINYALLSSSSSSSINQCVELNQNSFLIKEDIPIDLSVKKSLPTTQSIVVPPPPPPPPSSSSIHHNGLSFGSFKEYDEQHRHTSFISSQQSQSLINDWQPTAAAAAAATAAAAVASSGRYPFSNLLKHHYHHPPPPPPPPSSVCGQLPQPSSSTSHSISTTTIVN